MEKRLILEVIVCDDETRVQLTDALYICNRLYIHPDGRVGVPIFFEVSENYIALKDGNLYASDFVVHDGNVQITSDGIIYAKDFYFMEDISQLYNANIEEEG